MRGALPSGSRLSAGSFAAPPMLAPQGPQAEPVATLTWVLLIGSAAILAVVLLFLAAALFGGRWRRWFGREWLVIGGGVIFPIATLSVLLVYGLTLTSNLVRSDDADPVRIHVNGEQWWWRVRYVDPIPFATANEVVIPVGRPALLDLTSDNVIHSFWVPELAGKLDMIPGKVNRLRLLATRPGVFYGACAEYCGGPHALMQFRVIALEPADFVRWTAAQLRAPPVPTDPLAARGAVLFQTLGCGGCHRIAGTPARGLAGPDLSNVGSRLHLAAGIIPNNRGTLAGWIANPQQIKPNVKMPSYSGLSAIELRALATYLDGLE